MTEPEIKQAINQLNTLDPAAPDRQFEAAIALGKLTPPFDRNTVEEALTMALRLPQSLTRAHVAEALGNLGIKDAASPLIGALKDSYQLVRSYAARALGKIGDRAAIEPLIKVLADDPFFGARAEAAEALRRLCANDNSPPSQRARTALKHYRDEELKRKDERGRRVLAEIDISLEELGTMIAMVEEAYKKDKNDYLAARIRPLLHQVRSRLGDLTAPIHALVPTGT